MQAKVQHKEDHEKNYDNRSLKMMTDKMGKGYNKWDKIAMQVRETQKDAINQAGTV